MCRSIPWMPVFESVDSHLAALASAGFFVPAIDPAVDALLYERLQGTFQTCAHHSRSGDLL